MMNVNVDAIRNDWEALAEVDPLWAILTHPDGKFGRWDIDEFFRSGECEIGALGPAKVVDIQFTNTAAKDFNGKLVFLQQAPTAGYVSKQYCVVKQP